MKTKTIETTAVVNRTFYEGKRELSSSTKNETIAVQTFVTEPAKVSVMKALRLNLGNFESAGLEVSVSIPAYLEEIDAAYEFADKWVEKRLEAERAAIRANKPGIF